MSWQNRTTLTLALLPTKAKGLNRSRKLTKSFQILSRRTLMTPPEKNSLKQVVEMVQTTGQATKISELVKQIINTMGPRTAVLEGTKSRILVKEVSNFRNREVSNFPNSKAGTHTREVSETNNSFTVTTIATDESREFTKSRISTHHNSISIVGRGRQIWMPWVVSPSLLPI